ncbi:MAG: hypothetical protein ACRCSA_16475, partial [Morganella morganii]
DELLSEKKSEQEKRRQAEEAAKKAAEEQARKNGDIESLEKSWAEKLSTREKELLTQLQEKDASLQKLLVDTRQLSGAESGHSHGVGGICRPV